MRQLPEFEEHNKLTCKNQDHIPGIYKTANGYVVRSHTAQVFLETSVAMCFSDDIQEFATELSDLWFDDNSIVIEIG